MSGPRRRWLAPEVVQTSAMDCGPAALKSLLEGFGVAASYGRLREACQTEVDGTSIDTLEALANQLGLEASQVTLPVDHLLLASSNALPAIVITRTPSGVNHFVVVWRAHGPFLQVMDPASGRRFMHASELLRDVYVHEMPVPAEAWREWRASEQMATTDAERLDKLGARAALAASAEKARQDPDYRALAKLDAAIRMVAVMVDNGALARGRDAAALLSSLLEHADTAIPERFWSARPCAADEDGTPQVTVRGAVLVQVTGARTSAMTAEEQGALHPDLLAVLHDPPPQPGRELLRELSHAGWLTPITLAWALALLTAGAALEIVLLRALLDIGGQLHLAEQRLLGFLALAGVLLVGTYLELPVAASVLRFGRALEARLRARVLAKLPRLEDRYMQSRPVSDMAERSHSLHALRMFPELGSRFLRTTFELVASGVGLIWLDPSGAWLVLAVLAVLVSVPWFLQTRLSERDLRMRSHTGALTRFYLDAMLGIAPVRSHCADEALKREHEPRLAEWREAGTAFMRAAVNADSVAYVLGAVAAVLLLSRALQREPDARSLLLLLYWVLSLPALAQQLALYARLYPTQRNLMLRALEPLGAREAVEVEVEVSESVETPVNPLGPALVFEGVHVLAAGHIVLRDVSCSIVAGTHVAIVGPSGAGKSSLIGLLLGFHRASQGRVLVDGEALQARQLERLRGTCAWVDPQTQLFNRSLFDNVVYGASPSSMTRAGSAIASAELEGVLRRLPDGLQTQLGENGSLVSGGEGQRVRLARALVRSGTRLALMDEPFRGLDGAARKRLLARTRAELRQATMLCATHDIGDTTDFDRVLVVEHGTIVEDGAPEVLLARADSRYAALLQAERALLSPSAACALKPMRLLDGAVIVGSS